MKHVRRSRANVTDHRFRGVVAYTNKLRPTICGAEPSVEDISKSTAEHFVKHADLRPDWLGNICVDCLKTLTQKGK